MVYQNFKGCWSNNSEENLTESEKFILLGLRVRSLKDELIARGKTTALVANDAMSTLTSELKSFRDIANELETNF